MLRFKTAFVSNDRRKVARLDKRRRFATIRRNNLGLVKTTLVIVEDK